MFSEFETEKDKMTTDKKEMNKVDRLRHLLVLAEKEEGQLENFKEQVRSDLQDGDRRWFPDFYAVFGLKSEDRVYIINEIAEVFSGVITDIGIVEFDDEEEAEYSFYTATCVHTNERGKEDEILLSGNGCTQFVRLIEPDLLD